MAAVVSTLLMGSMVAYASTDSLVMFGDNAQRTHDNGISDPTPWAQEAYLTSATDPNNGLTTSLASNSTAIGAGNMLFYPVSAPNDSPTGQGYVVGFDTSNWINGKPAVRFVDKITGVSNSSPVYVPSLGTAFLAAGAQLYAFDALGNITNGFVRAANNIYSPNPVYQNQVVSYPLYVTAAQQNAANADIWVSSQNGNLYAINPSTMRWDTRIHNDSPVNLGVRMDASPSLVTSANGTPFIAVTAAYTAKNKYPAGTLFLVNPKNGAITETLPDHYGAISSISSPIGIAPGLIMWSDTLGDVFLGAVNPNGTVTIKDKWYEIGGANATAYNAEAGYSERAHEYILPFSNQIAVGIVDTESLQAFTINALIGSPAGSPEISNNNLYVPDSSGSIDEIFPTSAGKFNSTSGGTQILANVGDIKSLTTPSEMELGTVLGETLPTLTSATAGGLQMWMDVGANYTFGSGAPSGNNWTNSSANSFDYPLSLTYNPAESNLPDPANYGTGDKFVYSMSVNGGSYTNVSGLPNSVVDVFDGAGNPQTSITINTTTLNQAFAPWNSPNWKNGQPNDVVIRVKAASGDAYGYTFNSNDVGNNQSYAQVDIQFPGQSSGPAPGSPPSPSLGCTSSGTVSCSSALPGYTEWRFLSPGRINTNEAQYFPSGQWFDGGTAYKLHPIPEQAITSAPAAEYTSYYTYQNNPDGQDTQPGNWLNNFTVEFVNGSGMAVNFGVKGEIKTIGDVLYKKTYISSWQPHWSRAQVVHGWRWVWNGYTPNYSDEYLYRNTAIDETTSANISILKNVSYWWNPSAITVTANGNFNSTETSMTPTGSGLTWTQPVWASYGAWIPSGETNGTDFSQVPVTPGLNNTNTEGLTPNSMLPGTPSDNTPANAPAPDTLNGVWYSDAPMPPTPSPGVSSPQGQPVSHSFDSAHNGGVIYEPNVTHSDYPQLGAGTWWVMPNYTITGRSSTFEHNQISTWIPTWGKRWLNDSGQGVTTSETSTVTWN